MKKLPDIMSDLIRAAIDDLELVEADSRYVVEMGAWHSPMRALGGTVCNVCLAGAVLAKTFSIDQDKYVSGGYMNSLEEGKKLLALNALRQANIGAAGFFMEKLIPGNLKFNILDPSLGDSIAQYIEDPALFKQQMLDLADILEVEGL